MENTTFLHPKKGCHLNFQEENDIVIYMVSFLGSLAVLPGNIISALFMDKIGRIRIIGENRQPEPLEGFFTRRHPIGSSVIHLSFQGAPCWRRPPARFCCC